MKRPLFLTLFLPFFVLVPLFLAWNQNVPSQFVYQHVVLFVSLGAFGALLGQFWLSRLLPRELVQAKLSGVIRWHKAIGYTACAIMLLHPVLIVARRFWVQQSDPIDNLLLVSRSPAMLPAVIAWILLALIVVLSLARKGIPAKSWRVLHGLLASGFAGLATWHVVTIGRHSNPAMSAFWIALAAGAVAALLLLYLPARLRGPLQIEEGVAHGSAQ